jgi:hypothetical protein
MDQISLILGSPRYDWSPHSRINLMPCMCSFCILYHSHLPLVKANIHRLIDSTRAFVLPSKDILQELLRRFQALRDFYEDNAPDFVVDLDALWASKEKNQPPCWEDYICSDSSPLVGFCHRIFTSPNASVLRGSGRSMNIHCIPQCFSRM